MKGIIISALAGEEEESAAREAGYALYLTKPIYFKDLTEAIRRTLPECALASTAAQIRP